MRNFGCAIPRDDKVTLRFKPCLRRWDDKNWRARVHNDIGDDIEGGGTFACRVVFTTEDYEIGKPRRSQHRSGRLTVSGDPGPLGTRVPQSMFEGRSAFSIALFVTAQIADVRKKTAHRRNRQELADRPSLHAIDLRAVRQRNVERYRNPVLLTVIIVNMQKYRLHEMLSANSAQILPVSWATRLKDAGI